MTHRPFALTALVLALASPAAAQSRAERQMNADIRMLQEQTQQLQLMLGTLTESIDAVSRKLDEQADTDRRVFADLRLLSDNISGDVRVVREKIDETNVRLASFEQEVQAIQMSIQALQLQPPAPVLPPDGAPQDADAATSELPPPVVTLPAPDVPPGVSPSRMFDTAHADYMSGQYSLSIQGFEAFVRTFPTLPQAAEAQYYIGENHRTDGQPDQALQAYDRVIANYPANSAAVAKARYRRAEILQSQGRLDAAKEEYELVVANYPDTSEARLAKQRLDGLLRPLQ
jgi:tol-pal system protein YbgF